MILFEFTKKVGLKIIFITGFCGTLENHFYHYGEN